MTGTHNETRRRTALGRIAAASAAVALAATGCSSTTATTAASESNDVGPVGYSALFLQDPAQSSMVRVFSDEAEALGLAAMAPTSANGDAAQQDTDIRNLVAGGAKSLMVIPADVKAVIPPIDFAREKGVRVASLMLGPDGGEVDVSMQVDNRAIGAQACEYLSEKAGPDGVVLQILGDLRQTTAQDRDEGFRECMESQHAGIRVVTKSGGQWEPEVAASSAAAVLASEGRLDGIFMASDGYAPSVAQAIRAAGRAVPAGEAGHVWTIAVDGTPTALAAIRDGDLDADLSQPVDLFVKYALEHLTTLAAGGELAMGATDHGSELVVTDSGYPADVFASVLVTADNVDDDAHWANTAA